MGFINYGALNVAEKHLKKATNQNKVEKNEKVDEEEIEVMDEGYTNEVAGPIITLDSLLNSNQEPTIKEEPTYPTIEKAKVEKELTIAPTRANIKGFNSLSISPIKIGMLSTEYDKEFQNSIDNKMIYR